MRHDDRRHRPSRTNKAFRLYHAGLAFTAVLLLVTVFSGSAAALDINSSTSLRYFPGNSQQFSVGTAGTITAYGNLNMQNSNNITNFFTTNQCTGSEVVSEVYSNGSYACTDISTYDTDTDDQNLSEVLTQGNVANQTIEFSNGIEIGDSSTTVGSNTDAVAVGKGVDASGQEAVAVGYAASATSDYASAVGPYASASAFHASAVGYFADASAGRASAFGRGADASADSASAFGSYASASADGAVAIGRDANAPNQYEATFGNLTGQELDVNVTGNVTVHGSGGVDVLNGNLDMSGNSITGTDSLEFGDGIEIGDGSTTVGSNTDAVAVGNGADASEFDALAVGAAASASDAEASAVGNGASASGNSASAFGDDASASGSEASAFGDEASASADEASAFGDDASASRGYASAVGSSASASASDASAFGAFADASAEGAVAIGYYANAPNRYEATFGNLGNQYYGNQKLDVNVTGNATVHGSLSVGGTECPDDEALLGDGTCGSTGGGASTLSEVLNNGNSAGSYNIDMSGEKIVTNSINSVVLDAYNNGNDCSIAPSGTITCSGSKNWAHQLNSTHEAVYSSQEGPDVRAVTEGTGKLVNGTAVVKLPSHFSKTVSNTRPDITVQVTPNSVNTYGLAVTDKSDQRIVVKELMSGAHSLEFDYRVTGIREGYENKTVVREIEKSENATSAPAT